MNANLHSATSVSTTDRESYENFLRLQELNRQAAQLQADWDVALDTCEDSLVAIDHINREFGKACRELRKARRQLRRRTRR